MSREDRFLAGVSIGIVGGGVVGQATARSYVEYVRSVAVYDVVPERRTRSLPDTLEADIIFVCLPTPQKEGSLECDTSFVEKFFSDHAGYKKNFVLKSTVPVGTTQRLSRQYSLNNLVHSPEFLTARCATTDAHIPSRNVIGALTQVKTECEDLLKRIYSARFPGVPIHVMFSEGSEAVKLICNSFFGVKLAFFNECVRYLHRFNIDSGAVMQAVLADGRIAHSHTKVPGPDGKYGFGGACLPKDLANLLFCMGEDKGLVLQAALKSNERIRNPPAKEKINTECGGLMETLLKSPVKNLE